MKRVLSFGALGALALLSCSDGPTEPQGGGIDFEIHVVRVAPTTGNTVDAALPVQSLESERAETADEDPLGTPVDDGATPLGEPMSQAAAIDSARIRLSGPESRSVSVSPPETVTFDELPVGTYSADLEAFSGDELTYAGAINDIAVTGGQQTSAEGIILPTSLAFIAIGETMQLDGPSGTTWQSEDENIVTVDAGGAVTAVGNGAANITGTLSTSTGSTLAQVVQLVDSVDVTPDGSTIAEGETLQFTATAFDSLGTEVTGVSALWVSSDHNVATIDQSGLATGTGDGSVTISASVLGQPGSASLNVTGTAPTIERIAFTTEPAGQNGFDPMAPIVVTILDDDDQVVTTATNEVELRIRDEPISGLPLGSNSLPRLVGTTVVTAVDGVATFDDVRIDRPGDGYSLEASVGIPAPSSTSGPEPVAGSQVTAVSQDFNVRVTAQQVASSADGFHTCILADTGHTYCAGQNFDLQLGRFTADSRDFVLGVDEDAPLFVEVAPGGRHTCGLTSGGAVFCWGSDGSGQLGNGAPASTEDVATPVQIQSSETFTQITSGDRHSCGLTSLGSILCWGGDFTGQLGDDATFADQPLPVPVNSTESFASVSAGEFHTCALNGSQQAFCWGRGNSGQLGNDTTLTEPEPVAVSGGINFEAIAAGGDHTCGFDSGQAYCWGRNSDGQLGLGGGDTTNRDVPTAIAHSGVVTEIDAGDRHTCAVTAEPLTRCWGDNFYGQVGNGTTTDVTTNEAIDGGGADLTQLGLGWGHSCAVSTTGEVFCWGRGSDGQLGNGEGVFQNPSPILVPGTGPSN